MTIENEAVPGTVEQFELGANFDSILRLLAEQLYPRPDVFVRELVQNAHDAIRRAQHEDPVLSGRIEIRIDVPSRCIRFTDNGIGMDYDHIRQFLSVIGSTGTGTARDALRASGAAVADALIGQFGVGALAGLAVADRVEVRTRRRGTTEGWLWTNDGTPQCSVQRISGQPAGTEVTLHIADRHAYALDPAWIREAVIRHCDLIALPIHVEGEGPVNVMHAPWDTAPDGVSTDLRSYARFAERRLGEPPIAVRPVHRDGDVTVRGVLAIRGESSADGTGPGPVDVHVRPMHVVAGHLELLPAWASFVEGILDCPDLDVTAARDDVRQDRDAWRALKALVESTITDWLLHLVREEPGRFDEIAQRHAAGLRLLAAMNDAFFAEAREHLRFETNRGPRTLRECVSPEPGSSRTRLHYLAPGEDERQVHPLADARGIIVINTRQPVVEELLARYAAGEGAPLLVRLDSTGDMTFFGDPTTPPRVTRRLEHRVEHVLRRATHRDVRVAVRRYDPPHLPAVLLASPAASAEAVLSTAIGGAWGAATLDNVTREALLRRAPRTSVRLVLNEAHPLIARVLGEGSRWPDLDDVLCGVYLAACLRARSLLSADLVEPLQPALVRSLDALLDTLTGNPRSPFGTEVPHAALH